MALKSAARSMISMVGRLRALLIIRVSAMWKWFDIRPIFFFGGLSITGYGLFLWFAAGPALVFVGIVLMVVGYLMRGGKS